VAGRKAVHSSKLVLKDVAAGSRDATGHRCGELKLLINKNDHWRGWAPPVADFRRQKALKQFISDGKHPSTHPEGHPSPYLQ